MELRSSLMYFLNQQNDAIQFYINLRVDCLAISFISYPEQESYLRSISLSN